MPAPKVEEQRVLFVRLPVKLYDEIAKQAAAEDRTLAAESIRILRRGLGQKER